MGQTQSTGVDGSNVKTYYGPRTELDKSVVEAIALAKQARDEGEETQVSFTRIVLKFPQIREAFTSLQLCFNEFDKNNDGTMDHSELREAMSRLTGVEMPQDEADELFRSGDLYEEGRISFQEFIVCLAIGYVLKTVIVTNIPEDCGKTSEGAGGGTSSEDGKNSRIGVKLTRAGRRPSFLEGRGVQLQEAFRLLMDAYLEFDKEGKGFVSQQELRGVIVAFGGRSPSKSGVKKAEAYETTVGPVTEFLTQDRMDEMDWDQDGYITYKEFVYSFLKWVGVDESEEDRFAEYNQKRK
jgi:calcium-binding protein CML